jgi:hypothetical protein
MKGTMLKSLPLAALVCASMATSAHAQQVPIPKTPAEVPGPAPGTAMSKEYVQMVGRMAYLWGWPLVNSVNRSKAFAEVPEPGLLGGVVPVAFNRNAMLTNYIKQDQHFVTCTNQDVVYGAGYMALDKEPIVFQVPDFGDRFWVYAHYDARTDEFSEIGKQYGTKPGFYMMVGPNWKGETPAGITAVVRSSTSLAFVGPRVFMDDTEADHKAIQPLISQVVYYPLSEFDGKMKTKDWSKLPHFPAPKAKGETKWVNPETYFDELPAVYIYTDDDSAGKQLNGKNSYTITFAKVPPVNGFWSLTLYDDLHMFHPNALNRYSLGTKDKKLKFNADGSLTLYAGAKSPGKDKESNWLPAPEGTFSLYIRAYWADKAILDGQWKPPIVKKMQ